MKKIFLVGILALNSFLFGIKKDRHFNRDEIKHALDLITDKTYKHEWSKWLIKNTENQIKSFAMFQQLSTNCNGSDNLLECNKLLEYLDDLIIKDVRRLDESKEAKALIKSLEEKRNYYGEDL